MKNLKWKKCAWSWIKLITKTREPLEHNLNSIYDENLENWSSFSILKWFECIEIINLILNQYIIYLKYNLKHYGFHWDLFYIRGWKINVFLSFYTYKVIFNPIYIASKDEICNYGLLSKKKGVFPHELCKPNHSYSPSDNS